MRTEGAILIEDCIEGNLYRIDSRNLSYGVFTKHNSGFLGVRQKFSLRYLFTEYHWDTGAPFGTVSPLEDLGKCPVGGTLDENNSELFNWLEKFIESQYEKTKA